MEQDGTAKSRPEAMASQRARLEGTAEWGGAKLCAECRTTACAPEADFCSFWCTHRWKARRRRMESNKSDG